MSRQKNIKPANIKIPLSIDMKQKNIFEARMPDGSLIVGTNVEDVQEKARIYLSGIQIELLGAGDLEEEDSKINNYVIV